MPSRVSLNHAAQSTTTSSLCLRRISMTCFTPAGVMSSAISGEGGASKTRIPDEWLSVKVWIESGFKLRNEFGHGLVPGVQVQQDRDIAELERGVHQGHPLAQLGGCGNR